jgi:hypothetical protein
MIRLALVPLRPGAPARRLGSAVSSAVAIFAALTMAAAPAFAAAPPAYSDVPGALTGNVASIGFEATATSEFGDLIQFGGTDRARADLPVTVVMSSWACESDSWNGPACTTTPGKTFPATLTLTLYNVVDGETPAVGDVILQTTKTFQIPYRPSWDQVLCPADGTKHRWYSPADKLCYNGLAHEVTFKLPSGDALPDELIWTVSYSTAHYGPNKTGDLNSPMNSLNVGAQSFGTAPYGVDVEPNSAFDNSGTGVLHDEAGWDGNAPLACFGTSCPLSDPAPKPTQEVGGATGRPTPAPTSTASSSNGEQPMPPIVQICVAFGAIGLLVGLKRRTSRI